jgi:hypothetical protein
MALDTYGLSEDKYLEIFEKKAEFAIQCLGGLAKVAARHNVQLASLGEKFTWNLFSEIAYATDEEARVIQTETNPDEVKKRQYMGIGPSRDEMMDEIKSVGAKTEALVDYVSELATSVRPGITD